MFSEFIDQVGVKTLSLVFDCSIFTIHSWRRRNMIPRDRWDRLMEVNQKLTYGKLRDMEIASKTKQRA